MQNGYFNSAARQLEDELDEVSDFLDLDRQSLQKN